VRAIRWTPEAADHLKPLLNTFSKTTLLLPGKSLERSSIESNNSHPFPVLADPEK